MHYCATWPVDIRAVDRGMYACKCSERPVVASWQRSVAPDGEHRAATSHADSA